MKYRAIFIWLLIVSYALTGSGKPFNRRLAWKTPAHIEAVLTVDYDVNADLPVPILDHERPFTRGTDNTVTWMDSMAAVFGELQAMQMTLQFWAVEARAVGLDSVWWGFVDADENYALFTGLPEGEVIEYRLRYYARDMSGTIHMSDWSRAEISVQDASPPDLLSFEILELQDVCGNPWVLGPQIRLHIKARDIKGQIMQVAVHEISDQVDRILFDDIDARPRTELDTTLLYSILTGPSQPLNLKCKVIDVAEFYSDSVEIDFFYLASDPKVVCFPNPFVPDQNQCTVIKVENPDAREAKIFDPFGNLVKTLSKKSVSDLAFEWFGNNDKGEPVSRGGYICIIDDNRDLYCKIAVIR